MMAEPYEPRWWGDLERVAKSMIEKLCWMTWQNQGDREYSFEDIYQEAYLCYHRCAARYTGDLAVYNAKHFRALFCRSLYNCIAKINARILKRSVRLSRVPLETLVNTPTNGREFDNAEFKFLIDSIPDRLSKDMMQCAGACEWKQCKVLTKTRQWLASEKTWF